MSTKVPLFSYCREEFLSHKHRTLALVMVALVCCALSFYQIAFIAEEKTNNAQIVQIRSHTTDHTSTHDEVENKDGCHCQSSAREEMVHGDLLNRKDLLRMARAAKEQVIEHLRIDYGDYMDAIFLGPGKSFSPMSERSVERLKRKLTMKVLEMQINVMKAEKQTCDCEGSSQKSATYAKYVWATGGHSAAAGHGNLFNESYTAYLGRDARIVFGAIGIEFEDRNYAMGGTTSGLEVSMCWQQIFGVDVDFVSWDYGMTDGNYPQRMLHFGYRGGLSKGRPAMLAMRIGGRSAKSRESALQTLEDTGMSVFVGTDSSYSLRNGGVPDSAGLTRAEIEALPQYVQNLRCGDQFENGDPYCRQEKYTTDVCMSRPKQTGWHPGFKSHAMDGHALGLFLVDRLIDTLADLSEHQTMDPIALLHELQKEEDDLHKQILLSQLPVDLIFSPSDGTSRDPTLDLSVLWKGPSLCRTGRLPAQSRYLGYTTNTSKVGNIAVLGLEEYDTGISILDANKAHAANEGFMALTYQPGGIDRTTCSVPLKPDYKDFFYVHQMHGRAKLSVPNEKERLGYGYDSSQYKGLIILVFGDCEWGKCAKGEVRPEGFLEAKFEMAVNGAPVIELTDTGFNAWIVKGEDGFYWQADSNGIYDIAITVKKEGGFLKLSSVILY